MAFGNDANHGTITLTQGEADAILKEYYSDDGVTNALFRERPLLALMPKKEDVTGRFYNQPIYVSTGQAQSRTFGGSAGGLSLITAAGVSGERPYDFQVPKVENA